VGRRPHAEFVADKAQWVGDETDKAWDGTAGARHAVADGADTVWDGTVWDGTAGARHAVADGLDKINPF
jgi:hypothetical protein